MIYPFARLDAALPTLSHSQNVPRQITRFGKKLPSGGVLRYRESMSYKKPQHSSFTERTPFKRPLLTWLALLTFTFAGTILAVAQANPEKSSQTWALAIHGGAGEAE